MLQNSALVSHTNAVAFGLNTSIYFGAASTSHVASADVTHGSFSDSSHGIWQSTILVLEHQECFDPIWPQALKSVAKRAALLTLMHSKAKSKPSAWVM